ncbi:transposase [Nonomuraea jiangxiensis]|uniref:transposase n=1 Tax=Nonomuraea jiangxiensis TaxID=633440 RepID=UPI003CCC1E28
MARCRELTLASDAGSPPNGSYHRAGALDIGRPPEHDLRDIPNAILYVNRTGIPWRYLPRTTRPGRPPTPTSATGRKTASSSSSAACSAATCAPPRATTPSPAPASSTPKASRPPPTSQPPARATTPAIIWGWMLCRAGWISAGCGWCDRVN